MQNVLNRHHEENNAYYDPNLYIKGVVNQEIPYLTEDQAPPVKGRKPTAGSLDPTTPAHSVALYSGGIEPPARLSHDVLVPANIKDNFGPWEKELLGAGVHVHSKVIVIDPFGENPVVMTGSHNLGFKASSKNDDNLVIIEGNAPLAAAYAVNIIATFQTYRWNSYVEAHRQDPKVWHGLQDTDSWQEGYLQPGSDHLAELQFWMGKDEAALAPTVAAQAVAAGAGTESSASVQILTQGGRVTQQVNAVSTRKPHSVQAGKPIAQVSSIDEHGHSHDKQVANGRKHTVHTKHPGKKVSGR